MLALCFILINHSLERNVSYINSNDLQLIKRLHQMDLHKKASTLNYEETDMKVEFKLKYDSANSSYTLELIGINTKMEPRCQSLKFSSITRIYNYETSYNMICHRPMTRPPSARCIIKYNLIVEVSVSFSTSWLKRDYLVRGKLGENE